MRAIPLRLPKRGLGKVSGKPVRRCCRKPRTGKRRRTRTGAAQHFAFYHTLGYYTFSHYALGHHTPGRRGSIRRRACAARG